MSKDIIRKKYVRQICQNIIKAGTEVRKTASK